MHEAHASSHRVVAGFIPVRRRLRDAAVIAVITIIIAVTATGQLVRVFRSVQAGLLRRLRQRALVVAP